MSEIIGEITSVDKIPSLISLKPGSKIRMDADIDKKLDPLLSARLVVCGLNPEGTETSVTVELPNDKGLLEFVSEHEERLRKILVNIIKSRGKVTILMPTQT